MALRYLARRARVPAAAAALRPPAVPRVLSPSAVGSRSLTTKGGGHDNGVKFEQLFGKKFEQFFWKEYEQLFGTGYKKEYERLFGKEYERLFGKEYEKLLGEDYRMHRGKEVDEQIATLVAGLKAARDDLKESRRRQNIYMWCLVLSGTAIVFGLGVLAFAAGALDGIERALAKHLQQYVNVVKRIETENEHLRRENTAFRGNECVMRELATQGGVDYDALVQQATPELGGPRNGAKAEQSFGEHLDITETEIDEERQTKIIKAELEAVREALKNLKDN